MKKIAHILFCIFGLTGCDPGGTLSITNIKGNVLKLPCGEVDLNVSTTRAFLFTISQDFRPHDTITVYPDSLILLYKKKIVQFELWDSQSRITSNAPIMISSKSKLNIDFMIEGGVAQGDTLYVLSKGYIYCDQKNHYSDTIKILVDKEYD